jgi:uncharacterized membrane protein YidH (DUF202 family)
MMVEPEPVDASRRTRLANERTYLAWMRTSLTALAVAVGAGKIVPGSASSVHCRKDCLPRFRQAKRSCSR